MDCYSPRPQALTTPNFSMLGDGANNPTVRKPAEIGALMGLDMAVDANAAEMGLVDVDFPTTVSAVEGVLPSTYQHSSSSARSPPTSARWHPSSWLRHSRRWPQCCY